MEVVEEAMSSKRWLSPWKDSLEKPAIYHCISRVVDRRFVFGDDEREHFRMFMRMQENFSGCRVLSYCLMCNHLHLLLEVTPMPAGGLLTTRSRRCAGGTTTSKPGTCRKRSQAQRARCGKGKQHSRRDARPAARLLLFAEHRVL